MVRVAVRLVASFRNVRLMHGYGGRLLAAGDLFAAAAFQIAFLEFVHDLFDLLFLAGCFLRHDYAPLKARFRELESLAGKNAMRAQGRAAK